MTENINIRLRLSLQHALLGEVKPNLRAVAATCKEKCIFIRYIYDGIISDHDRETSQVIGTEVISDFAEEIMLEEEFVCSGMSEKPSIDFDDGWFWAYMRKEN